MSLGNRHNNQNKAYWIGLGDHDLRSTFVIYSQIARFVVSNKYSNIFFLILVQS